MIYRCYTTADKVLADELPSVMKRPGVSKLEYWLDPNDGVVIVMHSDDTCEWLSGNVNEPSCKRIPNRNLFLYRIIKAGYVLWSEESYSAQ